MNDFSALGISQREFYLAQSVEHRLSQSLLRRNLLPAFSSFNLTRVSDMTLFIAVLDTSKIGDHRPYTGDLLHQISTDLGGLPVYLSNSTGIRYVILLSKPPRLPHKVDLPLDIPRGQAAYQIIERALAECDQRAAAFKALTESPQTLQEYNAAAVKRSLPPLPRMLVIPQPAGILHIQLDRTTSRLVATAIQLA